MYLRSALVVLRLKRWSCGTSKCVSRDSSCNTCDIRHSVDFVAAPNGAAVRKEETF
jgi:hypothetical protein